MSGNMLLRIASLCVLGIWALSSCRDQESAHSQIFSDPNSKDATIKPVSFQIGPSITGNAWKNIDDPEKDGWESEVFSEKASQQLKSITSSLTQDTDLSEVVASDFSGTALVPETTFSNVRSYCDISH